MKVTVKFYLDDLNGQEVEVDEETTVLEVFYYLRKKSKENLALIPSYPPEVLAIVFNFPFFYKVVKKDVVMTVINHFQWDDETRRNGGNAEHHFIITSDRLLIFCDFPRFQIPDRIVEKSTSYPAYGWSASLYYNHAIDENLRHPLQTRKVNFSFQNWRIVSYDSMDQDGWLVDNGYVNSVRIRYLCRKKTASAWFDKIKADEGSDKKNNEQDYPNEIIKLGIKLCDDPKDCAKLSLRLPLYRKLIRQALKKEYVPVISFIGDTGVGKSFIISQLLSIGQLTQVPTSLIGEKSTTANILLYIWNIPDLPESNSDSSSSSNNNNNDNSNNNNNNNNNSDNNNKIKKVYLLDFEGENGTNPVKEEYGLIVDRCDLVKKVFPKLAYLISDIVVYTTLSGWQNQDILQRCLTFADAAKDGVVNNSFMPSLVIVSNRNIIGRYKTDSDETLEIFKQNILDANHSQKKKAVLDNFLGSFASVNCFNLPICDETKVKIFDDEIQNFAKKLINVCSFQQKRLLNFDMSERLWLSVLHVVTDRLTESSSNTIDLHQLINNARQLLDNNEADLYMVEKFKAFQKALFPQLSKQIPNVNYYDRFQQSGKVFMFLVAHLLAMQNRNIHEEGLIPQDAYIQRLYDKAKEIWLSSQPCIATIISTLIPNLGEANVNEDVSYCCFNSKESHDPIFHHTYNVLKFKKEGSSAYAPGSQYKSTFAWPGAFTGEPVKLMEFEEFKKLVVDGVNRPLNNIIGIEKLFSTEFAKYRLIHPGSNDIVTTVDAFRKRLPYCALCGCNCNHSNGTLKQWLNSLSDDIADSFAKDREQGPIEIFNLGVCGICKKVVQRELREDVQVFFGTIRSMAVADVKINNITRSQTKFGTTHTSNDTTNFGTVVVRNISSNSATFTNDALFPDVKTQKEFEKELQNAFKKCNFSSPLIFVHGFNNSFEDAIRRIAMVSSSIAYEGPVLCFSWPSQQNVLSYNADAINVMGTVARDAFLGFINTIRRCGEAAKAPNKILPNIMCHSIGSRLVLNALVSGHMRNNIDDDNNNNNNNNLLFSQIVFVSPDVSQNEFEHNLKYLDKICKRVTLYYCMRDKALRASEYFNVLQNAGRCGLTQKYKHIDLINVTNHAVGGLFSIDHDPFTWAVVLDDMKELFNTNEPAIKRLNVERINSSTPISQSNSNNNNNNNNNNSNDDGDGDGDGSGTLQLQQAWFNYRPKLLRRLNNVFTNENFESVESMYFVGSE